MWRVVNTEDIIVSSGAADNDKGRGHSFSSQAITSMVRFLVIFAIWDLDDGD